MVLAVYQEHADVDHRVAGQHAFLQRFAHTLLHRDDELIGDRPTADLVHKLEAGTARQWLDVDETHTVLPVAAGLLHIASLRLGFPSDRFPGWDPPSHQDHVYAELPSQPVGGDLQVRLTHAGDDRLLQLGRAVDAERRIFLA